MARLVWLLALRLWGCSEQTPPQANAPQGKTRDPTVQSSESEDEAREIVCEVDVSGAPVSETPEGSRRLSEQPGFEARVDPLPYVQTGEHAYRRWQSQPWNLVGTLSHSLTAFETQLDVTYFSDQDRGVGTAQMLPSVATHAYQFLAQQIGLEDAPSDGCGTHSIVLYELGTRNLNNQEIVDWYPWRDANQRLYGIYDSRHTDPPETSAILVRSDVSLTTQKRILAHEMVHYWFDMCTDDDIILSEAHAQAIEVHY